MGVRSLNTQAPDELDAGADDELDELDAQLAALGDDKRADGAAQDARRRDEAANGDPNDTSDDAGSCGEDGEDEGGAADAAGNKACSSCTAY